MFKFEKVKTWFYDALFFTEGNSEAGAVLIGKGCDQA